MLDDLSIRNKLILLVAGPILIVVILAALGGRARQASASDSRRVEGLVAVAQSNSDVIDNLQQEQIYSAAHIGSGHKAWKKELGKARKATDVAMQVALGRLQSEGGGGAAGYSAARGLAVQAADKLSYVRKAVDQGYRWDQAITTYASTEDTFLAVNTAIADSLSDPKAGAQLRTAAALVEYKTSVAREGAILAAASEAGGFATKDSFDLLKQAGKDQTSNGEILASIAGTGAKGSVRDALATDENLAVQGVRDAALEAGVGKGALKGVGEDTAKDAAKVASDLHGVEAAVLSQLISDTQSASSNAERSANLFLVAALVAVVGASAAAVMLGRRITRPLMSLTAAADHLSTEQMPHLIQTLKNPSEDELGFQLKAMRPIEVSSNDEIGQLAKSFNEVQRVAGEVASEQAQLLRKGIGEMFVNLARRNQALLDRQIEFIDELERGEEDPDQLDNLYKLDHLATRMRRNAESLLVLAGAEPPRRRGRPAPLANVVRAALAEVEDFGRIELLSLDEVLVASNAAADLAHLLSELMENATNFSPPETRVEVVGHKTKADGYVISVTDHGIGMSTEQIAEANDSLAKPPLVGLAMTRSLGFIVVGRLAARHGIAVRMMSSASGGVTAVVSLAPSLVVDTPGGASSEPTVAPARLKSVLDRPGGSGDEIASTGSTAVPPLTFTAFDEAPAASTGGSTSSMDALSWDGPALGSPSPAPAAPEPRVEDEPAPSTTSSGLPARGSGGGSAISASNLGVPGSAPGSDSSPLDAPIAWDTADEVVASPAPPDLVEPPVTPAVPAPGPEPLPAFDMFDALPEVTDTSGVPAATVDAPSAPLMPPPAPVAAAPAPPVVSAAPQPAHNRPFFLEDAEPPRPFAAEATETPTRARPDGAPPAPPTAPATNGNGSSPTPPRLFGGPPARPAATPAAPPTPPRMPAGATTAPRPPAAPAPAANGSAPNGVAAAAGGATDGKAPLPSRTGAGLTKRVPRQAGGQRAIPGSEGERGVGATKRSPDEIRQMLSRHSAGRQRAQTEPVPAGSPDGEASND